MKGVKKIIEEDEEKNGSPDTTVPLKRIAFGYGVFFCIASIELMIKWNHIEGPYETGNTGQLIPFIVSLYGFVQVFCKFLIPSQKYGTPTLLNGYRTRALTINNRIRR